MTELRWRKLFGTILGDLIAEKGISYRDLSELSGISTGTLSKYVNAHQTPGVMAIIKIAKALECDVADLIDFE